MISIIVPTHNRAHCLFRALDSVLAQTYQDWELIVVDDASTDHTAEAVTGWIESHKLNYRARFVRLEQNRGVSAARNAGASVAKGDWLAFLDSDDEWLPHRLERQIPLQNHFCLIHSEEIWIRNGVRVNAMKKHAKSGGQIFNRCVDICFISPSSVLLKRSVFEAAHGFREDFPVCEDYELWLRLSAQYEVGFIEEPLLKKYGGHDDQLSRSLKAMDYYRVKALVPLLESSHLQLNEKLYAAESIAQRSEVLLKGYQKHNNLTHVDQVLDWASMARKFLTANQIAHSAAERRPLSDETLVL